MIRYFEYPSDGWNNWKVIAALPDGTYHGVTKMLPSGAFLDWQYTGGIYRPEPTWKEITQAEAIQRRKV